MDNKHKHLDYIQDIIKRHNSNSFIIKGWCVSIVSALFVFTQKDNSTDYFLFSLLPCVVFWILDSFYLSSERKYVDLYNDIANVPNTNIDYSLKTSKYESLTKNKWICCFFSKTLIPFYGLISIGIIVINICIIN